MTIIENTSARPPAFVPQALWKSVTIVASGNFLEMYDFMVFGFYATVIAQVHFPGGDEYAGLMLTLMTFGAGFLMRPIGALVLGAYLDRYGRRTGLLITLGLMAVGTLTIAATPGYMTIGLAAPFLILMGRLVQGLSAGVELGGVSVYLSEIAPPGRKGFFVAWQSASQQLAIVFAALLGIALASSLSPEEMRDWGWRVPFIAGCMLIPFLFAIRRQLAETPSFAARRHHPTFAEIYRSLAKSAGLVVVGMMLVIMTTVSFYMITAYTPTFGTNELHLTRLDSLIVTLCVAISNFVLLPTMGALSDRVGRKPLLIAATSAMLLTAYPALSWLVAEPSFARLLMVELWFSLLYGSYNGAMVVFLTELMPPQVRTAGFSLAYSLATALGGFTAAISTHLIHETGNKAMPGAWLSLAAAIGLTATLIATRKQDTAQPMAAAMPAGE